MKSNERPDRSGKKAYMRVNSADFKEWISGLCNYSNPPSWRSEVSATELRIVPAWKPFFLWCIFFIGSSTAGVLILLNLPHLNGQMSYPLLFDVPFIFVGSGMVAVAVVILVTVIRLLIQSAKGPFVIYYFLDGRFSLPRAGLKFNRSDVVGWRVVSGNWVGPERSQRKRFKPVSELQLVVRESVDTQRVYVIAGTLAPTFTENETRIAELSALPFEIVVQQQGISFPAQKMPNQGWRVP